MNNEQGAKLVDLTGGEYVIGARVRQLKKLSAAFDPAVALSTETEGGPFGVRVTTDDLRALARIEDLPAKLDVGLDLDAGQLTVDGHGDAVNRITVDADGDAPLFGRATDLHALIEGIPSTLTLDLAQTASGVNLNASDPIGLIELVASDHDITDPATSLPANNEQGASFRDTPAVFELAARVRQLQSVNADLGDSISLATKIESGPFSILAETADLTANARFEDLPAETQIVMNLALGTFGYKGFDASHNPVGVNKITFDANSATPFLGRASLLKGELIGVPPEINVGFDTTSGAGASVDIPSGNLGSLALLLSDGQNTALPVDQSILYHDNTSEFRIATRVVGLQQLEASFGDALGLRVKRTAGSRFTADIDVADALSATADIQDLPADATFGLDLEGTSTTNPNALTFRGRDENGNPVGINVLDLSASAAEPIFGAGQFIQGHIEQLPSDVELGFSQENGVASVKTIDPNNPNALGPAVGKIELAASDTAGQFEYPTDGVNPAQGAILHTKTGEPFRIGVRINQLQKLDVDFQTAINLSTRTAGGVFIADVDTDDFEANAKIDQLPTQLDLGLDLDGGELTYAGNSAINRITANVHSATPIFLGATDFSADLQGVPTAFTIGLPSGDEGLDELNLTTTGTPIGQIDITANSPNRAAPSLPAGQSGASFDSTGGELGLALRVFGLKALQLSLDPLTLHSEMDAGHTFVVDAKLPQTDENDNVIGTTAAQATIDKLPSNVTLSLADLPGSTEANPLGSRLSLIGNARIGLVKLATQGLELLEGADKVDAQIEDLPEGLTLDLPEADTGQPLARIAAVDASNNSTDIGQIRLAAGSGVVTAPADTYNLATRQATGNDQLVFNQTPANFAVSVRLSAVKTLSLNLEPINISLTQDEVRNRPVTINATLPNTSGPAGTVVGTLNKPTASTSLSVQVATGQPTKLIFNDSGNIGQLDLTATNLGSIPQIEAHLQNLSRQLTMCLDGGPLCRRKNAILINSSDTGSPSRHGNANGDNRPYPSDVSVDFDDNNTQNAGQFTRLDAKIKTSPTAPLVEIIDMQFSNLAFDIGQGQTFSNALTVGQSVPRMFMFFDSRNKPFSIDTIKYPPQISSFRIGTTASRATADRRSAWLAGDSGIFSGFNRKSAGSMNCGGRKELNVSLLGGVLNINVLNVFGTAIVPLC